MKPVAWQGVHVADKVGEPLPLFSSEIEANAWVGQYAKGYAALVPLYTAPPQRHWVGLTDEEIAEINDTISVQFPIDRAKVDAIEAKLRSKNT